ncbi:Ig-like domain-containing protein [Bacillus sp. FJAT-49736]|uniref:Ig-like domain-containing protein n=1 Tax=Bacillus sp. FJAT-49736 TaxID=2833582 RepID=UPI001BC916E2|nr:Ig-like domain-containing protein [Bacillus sp. FJAT-49736]MBS4174219.1 DUF5011 domain-containing protein [Bacillus sp. FJAT-49736]
MRIKKWLALVLLAFLTLATIPNYSKVFAENDVTPLKLIKTSLNQTEVKIGDTIVMTFEVAPDLESGPNEESDSTLIQLSNPSGKKILTMMKYIGNNKYEFRWKVDNTMQNGEWSVAYAELSDNAGNISRYYGSDSLLQKLKFTVLNGISDVTPPKLTDVKVLTPNVKANGEAKLVLTIYDESPNVTGLVSIRHKKTDTYLSGPLSYNKNTKQYEAIIPIPPNAKNGVWEFDYADLADKFGNEKMYFITKEPSLAGRTLQVTGGSNDFTPPIFHSVKLSETNVYPGNSFTAYVNAEDKESGIDRVNISFHHIGTENNFWSPMEQVGNSNMYKADFPISLSQMSGDYYIDQIDITDKDGNIRFVHPSLTDEQFPTLTILPFFTGVNSMDIMRGTSFDPLEGIKAYSPTEGDLTDKIQTAGNVDTNENGLYLITYSVQSHTQNYTYKNYRWITVNDTVSTENTDDNDALFFNTNVKVGVPTNQTVSLIDSNNKVTALKKNFSISSEGKYAVSYSTSKDTKKEQIRFVVDKTAPFTPTINTVTQNSTTVTGKAEAGTTTRLVINGKYLKKVKVNAKGVYSFSIPKLEINTVIKVNATDMAGNTSNWKTTKVVYAPTLNPVSNKSTSLSGKTLPYETIKLYIDGKYIKSIKANGKGNFKATISRQRAGKEIKIVSINKLQQASPAVTTKVLDKIPPVAPIINKVTSKSTSLTGKGENYCTLYVYRNTSLLGKTKVGKSGLFKLGIPKQKKGTVLRAYLIDPSANQSKQITIKVQ